MVILLLANQLQFPSGKAKSPFCTAEFHWPQWNSSTPILSHTPPNHTQSHTRQHAHSTFALAANSPTRPQVSDLHRKTSCVSSLISEGGGRGHLEVYL